MPVVVGQIGVGYWGPNLLRNLVASPRTDLRAVADVSEERQDFVRNSYPSVRVGGLPGDVLGDPQIEAVLVATPAASHFDLAIQAIEAGKHVLIEKPMARTAGEVREIGKRAAENDVVAMVGHNGWVLIEDCAQAHFAEFGGKKVGLFGDLGSFSFYPGKNLGAYGDAGCLITDNDDLASRLRSFANHGSSPVSKHDHLMEGLNSRLDGIQAAVLSVKLKHILEWNEQRAHWASAYEKELAAIEEVTTPTIRPGATHVFHIYCIRTPRRDALRAFLAEKSIQTGIHYPKALPYLEVYEKLGYTAADFPVAHANQDEILSLPIYPELTQDAVEYVAASVRDFFDTPA